MTKELKYLVLSICTAFLLLGTTEIEIFNNFVVANAAENILTAENYTNSDKLLRAN